MADVGDAAVVSVKVGYQVARAGRTVGGAEGRVAVVEIGEEEYDPRFFGLAVAESAAGAPGGAGRQGCT